MFETARFDCSIKTNTEKSVPTNYKYPLVQLGGNQGVCNIQIGGTPSRNNYAFYSNGTNLWVSIAEMNGQIVTDTKEKITDEAVQQSNVKLVPKGTTLLSFKLSIGKTAIAGRDLYTNEAIAALLPKDKNIIEDAYLFHLFNAHEIELNKVGDKAFGKSLNSKYLNNEVKIPLPPLNIQQQIVSECEAEDNVYSDSEALIIEYTSKKSKIINNIRSSHVEKLDSLCTAINPSRSEISALADDTVVSFVEMASLGMGTIDKMIDKRLGELRKGGYTYFAENDILIAKITPCMENGKCAIAQGLTNGVGMGSTEFHVLRANTEKVLPEYLFAFLNQDSIRKQAAEHFTGASGHRRVPIDFYKNLELPILPLQEQQEIVRKISAYNEEINSLKSRMAQCSANKRAILDKYLK